MMRRFTLVRTADPSGVSGTGTVAHGVRLDCDWVVVQWRNSASTVPAIFQSMAHMMAVHGHRGATRVEWVDREKVT